MMKLFSALFFTVILASSFSLADGTVGIEQVGTTSLPAQQPGGETSVTTQHTPDLNVRPGVEKPKDISTTPDYQQSVMQNTLTQHGRAQAAINEEDSSALPDSTIPKAGKAKTYKEGKGTITVQEKKHTDTQTNQVEKTEAPKPPTKSTDLGHSDIE